MDLLDSSGLVGQSVGESFVRFDQDIPQDFLDGLKSERLASAAVKAAEYHRVASVPVACYDLWFRQGHDPYKWSARELLLKLNQDGLDGFITTRKAI